MDFCVRDDDTSFFTSPEELERAYGEAVSWGPVSLAVVPFYRAGSGKGVPEKFRGRGSIHPLHGNLELVKYLREGAARGRYEIMLHGFYHDELNGRPEFTDGDDLTRRAVEGRKYLEAVLGTIVRVFVPPHNRIGKKGLQAIARAGLHLCGTAGVRSGWPLLSYKSWRLWLRINRWSRQGGVGIPWVLELGDHREMAGCAVTPLTTLKKNQAIFDQALRMDGVFCAAAHYWELGSPSLRSGEPSVGEHLRRLMERARSDRRIVWRSVGEVLTRSLCVV